VRVFDLGLADYAQALEVQERAVADVLDGAEEVLLLLEHRPVITLGRQAGTGNLLATPGELERLGVSVVRASRGGEITCHFPGQLVAYPVLRIDRRKGGVRRFFMDLEEVVLLVLLRCGIKGERREGLTGVFVGERKIGSMGIGVRKWVSYHGLSLNVGSDLSLFSLMHPCGLRGVEPTSIHIELGSNSPSMDEIKEMTKDAFGEVFAVA
jgi:lipoyl(octanoyl) transferase